MMIINIYGALVIANTAEHFTYITSFEFYSNYETDIILSILEMREQTLEKFK